MYFILMGLDKPGMSEARLRVRPIHRDYLHAPHPGITLKLAGPMLAPDGKTMIGSLIVVDAPTLEAAEQFAAGDPYRRADLFAETAIRPWDWTTGNPDRS
jgi:uncharacterized protein